MSVGGGYVSGWVGMWMDGQVSVGVDGYVHEWVGMCGSRWVCVGVGGYV